MRSSRPSDRKFSDLRLGNQYERTNDLKWLGFLLSIVFTEICPELVHFFGLSTAKTLTVARAKGAPGRALPRLPSEQRAIRRRPSDLPSAFGFARSSQSLNRQPAPQRQSQLQDKIDRNWRSSSRLKNDCRARQHRSHLTGDPPKYGLSPRWQKPIQTRKCSKSNDLFFPWVSPVVHLRLQRMDKAKPKPSQQEFLNLTEAQG